MAKQYIYTAETAHTFAKDWAAGIRKEARFLQQVVGALEIGEGQEGQSGNDWITTWAQDAYQFDQIEHEAIANKFGKEINEKIEESRDSKGKAKLSKQNATRLVATEQGQPLHQYISRVRVALKRACAQLEIDPLTVKLNKEGQMELVAAKAASKKEGGTEEKEGKEDNAALDALQVAFNSFREDMASEVLTKALIQQINILHKQAKAKA